jgi:hypothetical protein
MGIVDKNNIKRILFVVAVSVGVFFAIWAFDSLILLSPSALKIAGESVGWISGVLICIAIAWRVAEFFSGLMPPSVGKFFLSSNAQEPISPYRLIVFCFLSAIIFQLPVLGAQVGEQWQAGYSARHGAIAGVLPFSDAKQHYTAGISMPITGKMCPLPARRPIHAANLASLFVLSGYHSFAVLAIQAALCGGILAVTCLYLSRLMGPSLALAVWVLVLRLSEEMLPCFMPATTGLWLGLIGACLIFAWIIHRKTIFVALSLGIFVIAFSARAGALFILPAIFVLGFWDLWKNKGGRPAFLRYFSAVLIAFLVAGSIPYALNSVYDTRGGTYQGNASYILYNLAVGGQDWRQVQRDYPDELKKIRGNAALIEFISARTKEAFFSKPHVFFLSMGKPLHSAFVDMPKSYFYRYLKPSPDSQPQIDIYHSGSPLYFIIFYAGAAFLFFSRALPVSFRFGLLVVLGGYVCSLPFIWLAGNALRYQAVTWILPAILTAGVLARRGSFAPPFSKELPAAMAIGAYIWVIFCIVIPLVHQIIFPFKLTTSVKVELKEKERLGYILVGPHTPVLRMKQEDGLYKRPDISIKEFRAFPRIIQAQDLFEPYDVGEQLIVALDLRKGVCRYFWSESFCIPDQPWVMQAIISPQSPPHVFRLRDIRPVDFDGRPLNSNILPYDCLYSSNNS